MKKFALVFLFCCTVSFAFAQIDNNILEKQDLITCLEQITEHPEIEPLAQVYLPRGKGFIIIQNTPFISNEHAVIQSRKLFAALTEDDLSDTAFPILLLTESEVQFEGYRHQQTVNLLLSKYNENKLIFAFHGFDKTEQINLSYQFQLQKIDEEWKIMNVSSQSRHVRD